jgi:hypothetical protein
VRAQREGCDSSARPKLLEVRGWGLFQAVQPENCAGLAQRRQVTTVPETLQTTRFLPEKRRFWSLTALAQITAIRRAA